MNHLSLTCTIFVLATILIPLAECRVLEPNDVGLIKSTCSKTPNPTLCVQLLQSDPRSASADVAGLALILVDVIKVRSTNTLNKINQLLKGGSSNKNALRDCASRYKAVLVGDVSQAIEALKTGDPKFAESGVSDVSVEATSCEQNFAGNSPLTNENNGLRVVADITRAIVRILL